MDPIRFGRKGMGVLIDLVIRHDVRGMGALDRDVQDLSLDAPISDLEAIIERLDLTSFVLAGTDIGGRDRGSGTSTGLGRK